MTRSFPNEEMACMIYEEGHSISLQVVLQVKRSQTRSQGNQIEIESIRNSVTLSLSESLA